jgi:hypothetical protein
MEVPAVISVFHFRVAAVFVLVTFGSAGSEPV